MSGDGAGARDSTCMPRDVALIAKAALEDWRAAAWRLERKAPRRYGARVQASVQEELEAVLDRLQRGLEPALFEKVLELMASEDESPPARLIGVKDPYSEKD